MFVSDPDTLKPDWKSAATPDNILTNLITDVKGNPGPRFLAAFLTERTLQKVLFHQLC